MSYLKVMVQSFEGLECMIMPRSEITGIIYHVSELSIFMLFVMESRNEERGTVVCLGSHWQPQIL